MITLQSRPDMHTPMEHHGSGQVTMRQAIRPCPCPMGRAMPPRTTRPDGLARLATVLTRPMSAARCAALAALVALSALLASPLQAQTTFVSNLNQPSEGNLSNVQDRAQSFTTGTHAAGYTLSSIVVGYNGGGTFAGSVWTANASGAAIARKHSLTAPSSFSAGDLTFTAPAKATLDAETTYTVVMELSTSQGVTFKRTSTVNPNEDSGAAAGWSIGDTYHYLGTSWAASGSDKPILIAIKGTLYVTPTNSDATGEPSIEGTPQLGSTLTAGAGDIADTNGLANAAYTYKWVRVNGLSETDIPNATGMTYKTTADDVGKSIKVVASFTDDDGYSETRTSNPVGPITARTCTATDLGGRVEVWRATLTVAPVYLADAPDFLVGYGYNEGDAGSLSDTSFPFNSRTFTVTELASYIASSITLGIDQGLDNTIGLPTLESLHLHFCDTVLDLANPSSTAANKVNWQDITLDDPEQADWSALTTIAVALSKPSNISPVGFPSVSGTPAFRSTLTADVGGITDGNGLKDAVHTYQWVRVDGLSEIDIAGEVDMTYTLTTDDIDKSIKVTASFTDDDGYSETRTSNPVGPITARTCTAPDLGGRVEVWRATLTVAPVYLADAPDFLVGYGYNEGDAGSLSDTSFPFNSRTFTVTELASYIASSITLGIDQGLDNTIGLPTLESLHLHFCDTVLDLANPTSTAANKVNWRDITLDDPEQADWSAATTIAVALSRPLTQNNPATGAPIITGTARVGETLRATTAEISDDDGKPSVFTYQWVRVDGSSRTDIGTGQSTYELRTADAGSTIEVEVTFTDVAGNSEGPLTSAATDVVASNNAPPAPEKPRVYGSSMQSGSTTVLEVQWQAPRHWTDNPPSIDSYDVRYRVLDGESWSNGPQDVTVTRATITGLTAGTHYEVQVRSTTANGDSVWSKAAKGRTRTAGRPHEGDVRLTGGSTDHEGRLEVRHNSKWGSVCDDRLEDTGNVALPLACQMMGYTGGELIPRGSVSLAPASQKTWLDDLRCFEGSTHWTGSPATRLDQCNHAGWGLENCSREEDAHLRCLGSGTQEIEDPPLTARFEDVPTTHDGETPFSFHLALSEPIRNGYASVRDQAFEVIGGTVTRARRVDGRSDRWEIRITPQGDTEVTITLAADRACGTRGALCTTNGRALSTPLAIQIPGPGTTTTPPPGVTPLTARFANVPSEHDGGTAFTVEVIFSEAPAGMNNRALRDALEVTRGTTRRVRKVNSDRAHRIVTVRPDGWDSVDIVLPPSPECEATGAICTNAGARLEAGLATRIQGPPGLTVADAEVQEGMNAVLAFAVTLDRAPYSQASVDYATSDGTATAGEDYSATSGTLTFAPGEREKTVSVPVLDDAHDEGSETMTLTLSSASGAHVIDGTAIGTINNSDPMPLAWMVRFGRTVGSHVVDALGQRLEGGTASHVTVGGIPLTGTPGTLPEAQSDDPFALPAWASGTQRAKSAQELSGNDLLLRSTFHLSSGAGEGAGTAYTAWGRVAPPAGSRRRSTT